MKTLFPLCEVSNGWRVCETARGEGRADGGMKRSYIGLYYAGHRLESCAPGKNIWRWMMQCNRDAQVIPKIIVQA